MVDGLTSRRSWIRESTQEASLITPSNVDATLRDASSSLMLIVAVRRTLDVFGDEGGCAESMFWPDRTVTGVFRRHTQHNTGDVWKVLVW